jgi:hypothetical protein
MVTTPARTGMMPSSRKAVTSQVHTNIGNFIHVIPGARMVSIVVMMLMAPMIDDSPSMWIEKIMKSVLSGP